MTKKDILLNGIVVGSHDATGDNLEDAKAVKTILKEKGLYKEVTTNDAMYNQACAFTTVANDLYQRDLKKSPFKGISVSPFIVNAVFSIELYLKVIHNAYGNNIKGHHLVSIYKGMPKKGKEHFINAANDVRNHYQLETGSDIHTCLASLNKAFEQWRYLYEHNEMGTELQSIRYTMHVSHEACCRVREECAKKT
jgi:hypothetical protein